MKVKKTFRIEEELVSELDKLAKERGISQTEALEAAIHGAIHVPYTEPYTCHTPVDKEKDTETSPEIKALIKQLDVKDQQIESLSSALVSAQETAKAAQALHAADKQTLALESVEQKKSRWARLKDAWRG